MQYRKPFGNKAGLIFWLTLAGVTLTANSYAQASVWAKMAEHDLSTAKQTIISNVPKAQVAHSHYKKWLTLGYQQSEKKAKGVHTYSGYISVMQYYLRGFNDYHTDIVPLLQMINPSAKWPGFIVGQRSGQIVVTYAEHSGVKNRFPPVGARLLSCNDMSTKILINRNIVPFTLASAQYPSTWQQYVPKLFLWTENPFISKLQTCVFMVNNKLHTYELHWRVTENPSPLSLGVPNFKEKFNAAAFGKTPSFKVRKFGFNAVWISIPIFAHGLPTQGTTTTIWLNNIADQIKKYRNDRVIVFDLRGNTGGDPKYMRPIIMNLYGKPYLRYLGQRFIWNKPEKIMFLATKKNLQHMIRSGSPVQMIAGMKSAIEKKEKSYIYEQQILSGGKSSDVNPVKAKVVLLTDGRCGSECNSFVLAMRSIPGVVQVGGPTAPVTDSTWNAVKVFPDNASAIVYPTGLILSPKVNSGVPIFPKYTYHGDLGDTLAVTKWIRKLYVDKDL